ncbi:MAG: cytochrome P450 [Myxococcales bacterium]|nr:cytochrome P450 [Myxococcota bacterium]MDW8282685.1 cytochrome P450 [Myxococcales bacterium]
MQLQSFVDRTFGRKGRRPPPGLRPAPRLSGGLPGVGHLVDFVRQPLGLLTRAHAELGEVAGFRIGPRRLVALYGPEAHEAVFRAPDQLLNPQEAYGFMTPIFGKGVVYDAPLETMGEQVKMLLPALKDRRMRTYGEAIVAEVEQSIAGWGEEGTIDLVEYCRVLTNFTSSRCLLGVEFREQMNEEFAAIYHDLERGITPIAYLNPYLPLPAFRRRDQARVRLVQLVTRIVEERRRQARTGEDFLQTLMEARYSDGRPLTEDEITGLLLAAMFAGHHTSSVTTAWTLLELLRDRRYLAAMVEQIDQVLGRGGPVTMQTVRELSLTEQAVKETLRLHPPLFMLIRVAQADWSFRDVYIPRGTWVVVSPTVSHLSPRYFRDPQRFDPDRFSPAREGEMADWSYIPFGGGRHKCLGNAFALLQIKTILAVLLSRYEFDLCGDAIQDDFQSMVIGPKEPCRLRYRRRLARTVSVPAPPPARPVQKEGGNGLSRCPVHAPRRRLRLWLDRDLCQGHAVCVGEAPEVFAVGADGKVQLLLERPGPELYDKVLAAEAYCPTHTIQVVEEEADGAAGGA